MTVYYRERIVAWWLLPPALALALLPASGLLGPFDRAAAWSLSAAALLVVALAGGMTITVDREAVRLRAPLGWPRTTVPLDEIAGVEIADRLFWKVGFGIKWVPGQARWNLSGNRGVVLNRRGGGAVWIGTPEPERLARAVRRALAHTGAAGGE